MDWLKRAESAGGWMTEREMLFLHATANTFRDGTIVEIGSWKGKSTICIASSLRKGMLYAIDTFEGSKEHGNVTTHREFMRNTSPYRKVITVIRGKSQDMAWSRPIDMLFIDGSHEYQDVLDDFHAYTKRLKTGGIVCMHDTIGWEGPAKVARDSLFKSQSFSSTGFVDSIAYGYKSLPKRINMLSGYKTLLLHRIWDGSRRLPIPENIKEICKKTIANPKRTE